MDEHTHTADDDRLTRRGSLLRLGGLVATGLAGWSAEPAGARPGGVASGAIKPYAKRPGRETRNASDAVFRNGGRNSLLRVRRSGTGYVGAITMGVHRSV